MNRCFARGRDTGRSTVTIFPSDRLSNGLICSTEPTIAVVGFTRPPRRSVSRERTWISTWARADASRAARATSSIPAPDAAASSAARTPRPCARPALAVSTMRTGIPMSCRAIRAAPTVPESSPERCTETTASNPAASKPRYAARSRPGAGRDVVTGRPSASATTREDARSASSSVCSCPPMSTGMSTSANPPAASNACSQDSGRAAALSVTTATRRTASASAPEGRAAPPGRVGNGRSPPPGS